MRAVRQLLDVVRRELGAEDAHIELGGRGPIDPRYVACELDSGVRLVARFADPPTDRDEAVRRLQAVSEVFAQTVQESVNHVTSDVAVKRPATRRALADALAVLAERCHAVVVLVVDVRSPVVWSCSDAALQLRDVETAEQLAEDHARARAAGVDPTRAGEPALEQTEDRELARAVARLRTRFSENPAAARREVIAARAITRARQTGHDGVVTHEPDFGLLVRSFSAIYRLVIAFDGPFSDLVAEPITRRALPVVERLVADLPPLDPTPEGAAVVVLRPK